MRTEPAICWPTRSAPADDSSRIALDPQFERTRHVFAIYTAPSRSGEPTFTLARFRESSDTLGDAAVLLDGVPAASPSPAAALRFGPDGKLYAAFDDGGRRAAPGRSRVAERQGAAAEYGWDDAGRRATARRCSRRDSDRRWRSTGIRRRRRCGWPTAAAGGSRSCSTAALRPPAWAGRMLTADTLFDRGSAADVSVVAVAPDGAIYFGTAGALGRLVPDRGP